MPSFETSIPVTVKYKCDRDGGVDILEILTDNGLDLTIDTIDGNDFEQLEKEAMDESYLNIIAKRQKKEDDISQCYKDGEII